MPVIAMRAQHWPEVRAIYVAGIATGNATFETEAPDWTRWDAGHLDAHRFVAVDDAAAVVGWIAASPVSDRCVYGGVVEHSVYVRDDQRGKGIGRILLTTLISSTEGAGIWTIQTGIFGENTGSLALHHSLGFRTVGLRERIGQHHGRWRDVVLLERRSAVV